MFASKMDASIWNAKVKGVEAPPFTNAALGNHRLGRLFSVALYLALGPCTFSRHHPVFIDFDARLETVPGSCRDESARKRRRQARRL